MVRTYGPWLDTLRSLPRERLGEVPPELARLLPERRGAEAAEGAADRRSRLFDAVVELVAGGAGPRRRPMAGRGSAAHFPYLSRLAPEHDVLLACAVRRGELAANPPVERLVRSLDPEGRLRNLALGALSAGETAQLLRPLGPGPDAESVRQANARAELPYDRVWTAQVLEGLAHRSRPAARGGVRGGVHSAAAR